MSSTSRDNVSQNIILNHDFSQGKSHWRKNNCKFSVDKDGTTYYANTTGREYDWSFLEQDITNRVFQDRMYKASAWVRIHGSQSDLVNAKLKLCDGGIFKYLKIEGFKSELKGDKWYKLEGEFTLRNSVDDGEILFYIFGPQPRVDLHIKSVELTCLDANSNETPSTSGSTTARNTSPGIIKNNQISSTYGNAYANANVGIAGNNQISSMFGGATGNMNSGITKNNEITSTYSGNTGNPISGITGNNQISNTYGCATGNTNTGVTVNNQISSIFGGATGMNSITLNNQLIAWLVVLLVWALTVTLIQIYVSINEKKGK